MTKSNKIKLVIAITTLIICIFQIQQTYAKYIESKDGSTDFAIANWKILLNDHDISDGAQLSSLINPVYENNNNVESGVIAPGSEGYFDLEIDATNTQVSFTYDISIASADDSDVTDLIISSYKIDDNPIVNVENGVNNLTNTINYNEPDKVINIRIYFKWKDGDGETMNNAADTAASVGGGTGKLSVNATFTQVANT